jgi:aryl-alcohol dehydrogenase-like predicted oxidoreductase
MRFRSLGDSDIQVSTISLGSWLTYSGGVERDATEACTRAAFEAGITFFDTANVYGTGASETAWGEILKGYDRDSYILATKVFFPMSDEDSGLSAAQIAKQIDRSLERLQTDYVDLYQCHRADPSVAIEETMEALSEVVRSGKARAIGFSEWDPEQIQAGLDVEGAVKFVSSQPQYSALWRGPEQEVFPLCAENGISQVVWSPLAEGVLTGKYQPGEPPPEDSRAASDSMSTFIKRRLDDTALSAVQQLRPIADGLDLTPAQLALAWVLRRPEVASAIVGASRPEQVFDNAKASDVDLDDDTIAAMDEILEPVAILDPTPAPGFQGGVKHR